MFTPVSYTHLDVYKRQDMTSIYDSEICKKIKNIARENNIDLKAGVYLQTTGPNYETPAEINTYKLLGADAVGMSTVCEAIAAVHCGFKVCGVSLSLIHI